MEEVKLPSVISRILRFLKFWLWTKPVARPEPAKAVDVINQYVVIDYKGQLINLKKTEIDAFNNLKRKDKRAMAQKFAAMEKKGQIRFEEIKGKLVAIKNKDYEAQADIRQSRSY
jgi:hypothetical protein